MNTMSVLEHIGRNNLGILGWKVLLVNAFLINLYRNIQSSTTTKSSCKVEMQ